MLSPFGSLTFWACVPLGRTACPGAFAFAWALRARAARFRALAARVRAWASSRVA